MKAYNWVYKIENTDKELFSRIKQVAGSDIITKLLISRGITDVGQAQEFLNPDKIELTSPLVFPDMQKAVDKINETIKNQEYIVIYGDFDSDGVTSTSLMYRTLKHLDANVGYYIPDRSDEGHGLNRAALCKLISNKKAKLIITVDCGISNIPEIKMAQSLGTNVIITDHHEPLEQIPEAYAIINPKMLDNQKIRQLAGVGVAFKLAEALLESHGKQEFIDEILPLVAIGTVGDVVPLLEENRTLVYRGLDLINKNRPASIAKLMEFAGHKNSKKITSTILAFTIVPRINAIGRLAEAITAVEFLVTDDNARQHELAVELDRNNKERQQICEETLKQAEEKIQNGEVNLNRDKAIILSDSRWHPGIVGLVASRLVEKYYRPALLVSLDERKKEARCSARSIDGLNIFEALSNFSEYYLQFGGHSLAAGFCADLEKISFEKLKSLILAHINGTIPSEVLKPELKIDIKLNSEDLSEDFIHELDKLAPYGELNPYPIFSLTDLVLNSFNTMGARKNHLKVMFRDEYDNSIEAVWWQKDHLDICPMEKVNVAFIPSINNFMDRTRIQLILKDVQPVEIKETVEECLFAPVTPEVSWIDHRAETGFKKEFLEYLKSCGDNLAVFAESRRALDIIENVPYLKSYIINRMNMRTVENLVIFDMPSDDMTFMNLIRETSPAEVHLFGLTDPQDPVELIKKVSGMLKYAHNEKNGNISLNQAASSLSVSTDLLFSCVQLLDSARVIEINRIKDDKLDFKFIGSVNLNSVQDLPAYHQFMESLFEFESSRNEYKTMEIELLRETIDNLDAFQCLP